MSLTTRPPGDAARPEPTRPAATPGANPAGPLAATPPVVPPAPPPSARTPPLDAAAALRVFVEEVRVGVEARLTATPRPEPLPSTDGDPGNAVAVLLRWIRAATAGTPLPRETIAAVVAAAHASAVESLPRPTPGQAAPGGTPVSPRGDDASRPAPATGAPVRGGAADAPAASREVLAGARDLLLRALVAAPEPRATAAASGPGERRPPAARDGAPGAASPAVSPEAEGGEATRRPATGADARAGAVPAGLAPGAGSGAANRTSTNVGGASPAATGARTPSIDVPTLLRTFVDEIRGELGRAVGSTRLPSAPLPLVTDAHGAQLAPALLRWLTSAVAERGVPLAPLQDAVRAAYARAAAVLPDVASPAAPPSPAATAREALLAVRDQVLRGLGVTPERLDAPAAREVAAPRVEARGELPVVDPRGVPIAAGATLPREERVEEIGARSRARGEDGDARVGDDADAGTAGRRGADDLQGPMDCIRRYFDAYLSGDSTDYAAQWVYPACVWSDGRWSAYANRTACARGNDEYLRAARAEGIVGGRIVMLRVEPTSDDVAVVHGVFTRERADGTVAAETEAAYTTVRTAAGWRVAVCVVKK